MELACVCVFKTGVLSKHMNNAYEIPDSSCFHTTFQPFLADQCILAHSILPSLPY